MAERPDIPLCTAGQYPMHPPAPNTRPQNNAQTKKQQKKSVDEGHAMHTRLRSHSTRRFTNLESPRQLIINGIAFHLEVMNPDVRSAAINDKKAPGLTKGTLSGWSG
eukprot:GHVT01066011.1.p2 GENE.GHVT01066011.1~~GHVT01066011.1.p2  ORF type:complete len:107 (-),score=5.15 GHVT01066011.1:2119-2439(-)